MALSVLSLTVLALHASLGRPIAMDEFLHFALGGYQSTRSALEVISTTAVGINHGQTGVYMLLDYGLLQFFGASPMALRLPSLLSGMLLLASGVAVLRARGFGLPWQILVIVALLGQTNLIFYVGEARPYMPLAAASLGTLAYYLASDRRAHLARALGFTSIVAGSLLHPYFPVYWFALFLFAHALAVTEGRVEPGWAALLRHVNLPLAALGTVIVFTLGKATWMRGGPYFAGFDPFLFVPRDNLYRTFVDHSHLQFLGAPRSAVLALVVATSLMALAAPRPWRPSFRKLLAPAALLLIALGISVLLSFLSYRRNYWILPRQWVASMALVPVAVVWFWGECARALTHRARWVAPSAVALGFLCLGWAAYPDVKANASALAEYVRRSNARTDARRSVDIEAPSLDASRPLPKDNAGWVALANENIKAGGSVWPIFRKFYGG